MPHLAFLTDPSPCQIEDLLALYRAAGWWESTGSDPAEVAAIVKGSHCFLTATVQEPGGREIIIGMGRSISDKVSDAYIQDVTVLFAHRGKGIAARIIEHLVHRLKADGIGWIGLIAERSTHELYRRAGFSPMPDATPMIYRSS